eukprot:CAMPEP_0172518710 /NCGR_PEP_ID=MMETSP1066-20121228/290980_1 /TAXON_ID=671091 /ORGANISM="Coscinodiscus wailesii, Strain CCMP2513" /LENGTH=265 /DNA_ID=CAMNT_0013301151 /DNA_START=533 /DNA_END=1330 /DNA_ORIENTATION=-
MDPVFESMFHPNDMRLLALVSHNNMKDAMKQFVLANKNIIKKFRLTGTNNTMSMLKDIFEDDSEIIYGPICKSGPLGGDAQLVAMAATGDLGGCIFFIDPMDAHPHNVDIDCLCRQANVHNILMMNNPDTAHVCLNGLRVGLKLGRIEMMPSFFYNLESPSVEIYRKKQQDILENKIKDKLSMSSLTQSGICTEEDINSGDNVSIMSFSTSNKIDLSIIPCSEKTSSTWSSDIRNDKMVIFAANEKPERKKKKKKFEFRWPKYFR